MRWNHRVAGATLILMLLTLSLSGAHSIAQTGQLRNDVLDEGGTKLSSSGYVCWGSFGEPTMAKISSSDYVAIIGFWHPPYDPPTGVTQDQLVRNPVPTVFSLSQNHPNPCISTTTISYRIPDAGHKTQDARHTNLSIYDLSGRLVRTLVDEKQEPGYYRVTWDLRAVSRERLPSGVYFYRIKVGDCIRTRKMVTLR